MAGGKFDPAVGKIRPGTYANVQSTKKDTIELKERGTELMPLFGHPYGPVGEFITIKSSAPDANMAKLGYSIYDEHDNMLLIREAFKKVGTVVVYLPGKGGKAATFKAGENLSGTAAYPGSRGDELRYSCVENAKGGFDVAIHLEADTVWSAEGLETVEELMALGNGWIEFTGSGALTAVAGQKLTGGADYTTSRSDITTFLDVSENEQWDAMAFPYEDAEGSTTLQEAVAAKIKYLNEDVGKYRRAVVANYRPDTEFVSNITNGVGIGDKDLPAYMCTALLAGADAGGTVTTSNTDMVYPGATRVLGPKTHEEIEECIKNGEMCFVVNDDGAVALEYDINSLVTITEGKDKSYRKNRVIRTIYTLMDELRQQLRPNRFDNREEDHGVMEGLGRAKLEKYEAMGAIKNVDTDADFVVQRDISDGDETYFILGIHPVDSAEKLFIQGYTR